MKARMTCPICGYPLQQQNLGDSKIPAYRCPKCEGIWISSNEYLRWVKTRADVLPADLTPDPDLPNWDLAKIKMCPGCGHILTRFRLLPHTHFFVDRCSECNSVWLDHHEWDVMVEHNLHDKINDLFTPNWQSKIREAEAHAMLDKMYAEKFGTDDYRTLQEMREWLTNHDQRAIMLAYLQAKDPYKM